MENDNNDYLWDMTQDLAKKKGVTEIIINGPGVIFVEKDDRFYQVKNDASEDDIRSFIGKVARFNGRDCSAKEPILDGTMPDGSRVNIVHSPYANGSSAITIRRYLSSIKSFEENSSIFGLNDKWISFFRALVDSKANIIISGGTGVGKTTFLNLLLREVSPTTRLITIEDTIELNVQLQNCVRLECSSHVGSRLGELSYSDLVRNSLRMRPDRIVLGEIRGGEMFDLLQAMNTGHSGTFASIHANSSGETVGRMENLFYFGGSTLPIKVVRKQLVNAVDFIVQLGRTRDNVRVIREISELTGMEGDVVLLNSIASWDGTDLKQTGMVPKCWNRVAGLSSHVDASFFN